MGLDFDILKHTCVCRTTLYIELDTLDGWERHLLNPKIWKSKFQKYWKCKCFSKTIKVLRINCFWSFCKYLDIHNIIAEQVWSHDCRWKINKLDTKKIFPRNASYLNLNMRWKIFSYDDVWSLDNGGDVKCFDDANYFFSQKWRWLSEIWD